MALALAGLGEVAADRGAPRRAGQLLGAGRALLPATAALLRVVVPYDLAVRLAAARARGDQAAFDRGLAEGQAWDIDTAVAAALDKRPFLFMLLRRIAFAPGDFRRAAGCGCKRPATSTPAAPGSRPARLTAAGAVPGDGNRRA
jgi:hypothetical protein